MAYSHLERENFLRNEIGCGLLGGMSNCYVTWPTVGRSIPEAEALLEVELQKNGKN